MKFSTNTAYILSASLFAAGMVGTLAWTKGGKYYGFFLLATSLVVGYYAYRKSHKSTLKENIVDFKQASLGALLILIDVSYNIIKNDTLKSFDHGMILSGIVIILFNTGLLRFLKLDRKMITFASFFIFIGICLAQTQFLSEYLFKFFKPILPLQSTSCQ